MRTRSCAFTICSGTSSSSLPRMFPSSTLIFSMRSPRSSRRAPTLRPRPGEGSRSACRAAHRPVAVLRATTDSGFGPEGGGPYVEPLAPPPHRKPAATWRSVAQHFERPCRLGPRRGGDGRRNPRRLGVQRQDPQGLESRNRRRLSHRSEPNRARAAILRDSLGSANREVGVELASTRVGGRLALETLAEPPARPGPDKLAPCMTGLSSPVDSPHRPARDIPEEPSRNHHPNHPRQARQGHTPPWSSESSDCPRSARPRCSTL